MDKNKIFSIYKQAFHNFIVSLSSIVSTGLFVGKIKYASGTFGSLLAIILCVPFCKLNIVFQFLIVLSIAIFGTISTHIYLKNLGDMNKDPKEVVIDEIVAEPVGGAHRDSVAAIEKVDAAIYRHLSELLLLSRNELKKQRNQKVLEMGHNIEQEDDAG